MEGIIFGIWHLLLLGGPVRSPDPLSDDLLGHGGHAAGRKLPASWGWLDLLCGACACQAAPCPGTAEWPPALPKAFVNA